MSALPMMDPKVTVINSPHVVILGAGASRATFPDGDKNSIELPLMCDLVQKVELEKLLDSHKISYENRNFEEIYDEIATSYKDSEFLETIEERIHNYFAKMRLPDELTLYDKIILCLRKKDLIATFNWDPFLALVYRRNLHIKELPRIVFLHGNVAIGVCLEDKLKGCMGEKCAKCGKYFQQTGLLYPIRDKNYKKNPFIANEWNEFESYLKRAYFLTIFGYNAPESDVVAIDMMNNIWEKNQTRELAEIDIIDIKTSEELRETWKEFIVRSHYSAINDFKYSYISAYPRRTCVALFMATMRQQPLQKNNLPDFNTLEDLHNWISPLVEEEILYREENKKFSGLPCNQIREKD